MNSIIEKAIKTGYDKIINTIFDSLGIPSIMRKPLKNFLDASVKYTATVAINEVLEWMGENPQATPSMCSIAASQLLKTLNELSGYKLEIDGITVSISISENTRASLIKLISVLKTKQD